jgi:hypothetical protein
MQGLRVRSSFADLITPIAHLVAERYYWVLENVLFVHQSAAGRMFDEIEYDEATLQQSNQLRLMDKSFSLRPLNLCKETRIRFMD